MDLKTISPLSLYSRIRFFDTAPGHRFRNVTFLATVVESKQRHPFLRIITLLFVYLLSYPVFLPAQNLDSIFITTNGAVNVVVRDGDDLYIGGDFNSGGYETGNAALVTTSDDIPDVTFPMLSGAVYAVIPDSSGGWYIGGNFFVAEDGQTYNNLIHVKADKKIDPGFRPDPNQDVRALALDGNSLYAGGSFTSIDGQSIDRLAKLNAETGAADGSWNPSPNNRVDALEISGDHVYAGGPFTLIDNRQQRYFARLDKTTGASVQTASFNNQVYSLTQSAGSFFAGGSLTQGGFYTGNAALLSNGSDVPDYDFPFLPGTVYAVIPDGAGGWYVGGQFVVVRGGQNYQNLVHITSEKTIDLDFNPSPNGSPRALLLDGEDLYVGGTFASIGGTNVGYLAKLNAATGVVDASWNPNPNNSVYDLIMDGTHLYAGGEFTGIGGHVQKYFAKVDKMTGTVSQSISLNNNVLALAQTPGGIYIGGSFLNGGFFTDCAALLSTTSDVPDYDFPITTGTIYSSISDGAGGWYIGGQFNLSSGGQTYNNLVHIKSDKTVDAAFDPSPSSRVNAMVLDGSNLYVGGQFTTIGGQSINRLAKLDAATGTADAGWDPNPNNVVYDLVIDGNQLYAAGEFEQIGGYIQEHFARIDKATGAVNQTASFNNTVYSLAQTPGGIYIGGNFTWGGFKTGASALISTTSDVPDYNFPVESGVVYATIPDGTGGWYIGGQFNVSSGGQTYNNLVHIKSDKTVDAAFDPSPNNPVKSLALDGGTLYAGGQFSTIGGQSINRLAKLDAATGVADAGWNPDPNDIVDVLTMDGDQLYAGGEFTQIDGHVQEHFAQLNKATGESIQTVSVNSGVFSLAQTPGGVYVGGNFGLGGFGTGCSALLSTTSDVPDYDFPVASGIVYASVPDGSGGWYIGGNFNVSSGGQSYSHLVHVKPDKTIDPAFTPSPNNTVRALVLDGSDLYAGGQFSSIGGLGINRLARLNAMTGAADAGWDPDPNNVVNALVLDGSNLYAAGIFTQMGGTTRNRLAEIDKSTGSLNAWDPNLNNDVNALALSAGTLFAGGKFSTVGGVTRNRVAGIDLATGTATGFDPNANNVVHALLLDGSTLYVGGVFMMVGGQTRNFLAAIDTLTSNATSWDPDPDGWVLSFNMDGSTLYTGGNFTTIGGQSRERVASIDKTTGTVSGWDPRSNSQVRTISRSGQDLLIGGDFEYLKYGSNSRLLKVRKSDNQIEPGFTFDANGQVYALEQEGDLLYVGGSFSTIGGQSRGRLAAVDTLTGNVTAWNPDAGGGVLSLRLDGNTVYAGGSFTTIGGQSRNYIASIDKTAGTINSWAPDANASVRAIARSGQDLLIGGSFEFLKFQNKNRFVKVRKSDNQIEPGFAPDPNGRPNTMAVEGNILYVGGTFSNMDGQSRSRLAALDTLTGNVTAWNPDANGGVNSLILKGDTVYVGGTFTTIGGQSRGRIASIDKTTGSVYSWSPDANATINTISRNGQDLFLGGNFSYFKYQERGRLLKVRKSDGQIEPGFSPDPGGRVDEVLLDDDLLYTGGLFTAIGGQSRSRLAAIDTLAGNATAWNPGANSTVLSLQVQGDTVYAGGFFATIGGQSRSRIASIDKMTGIVSSWNPKASTTVRAIAVNGPDIVIGGSFTYLKYEAVNRLVKIRKSDQQIDPGFSPNPNSTVNALALDGNTLYAGGSFTSIGGQSRSRLGAVDTLTSNAIAWNPGANSPVFSVALNGNSVYAGGQFTSAGGESRNYAASFDKTTGAIETWNPQTNGNVLAISRNNQDLVLGGNFSYLKYQPGSNLLKYNIATKEIVDWAPDPNSEINDMLIRGDTVYLGGNFTNVGGQSRRGLAAVNKITGNVYTGWTPDISTFLGHVNTLESKSDTLYIGGNFTQFAGQTRNNVAAVNRIDGTLLSWDPGTNFQVLDIEESQGEVFLGGAFTEVGGMTRNYIAAVDKSMGAPTGWDPNANSAIYSVEATGDKVYAGGIFTQIGGQTRNRIAALDRNTGNALPWDPNANEGVNAIALKDDIVMIGGDFTQVGGTVTNHFAHLDDSTGTPRLWFPQFNNDVSFLETNEASVIAAGSFSAIDDEPIQKLAILTPPIEVKAGIDCGVFNNQVCLDVTTENFTNMKTMQYSMHFDTAVITFNSIQNIGLPATFTPNTAQATSGILTFSWTDNSGQGASLPNGTVLYELCFDLTGTPGSTTDITIDGDPLALGFTNTSDQNLAYVLTPGLMAITLGNLNVWTGGGDGVFWSDSANWCLGVPVVTDSVLINTGTVSLDVQPIMSALVLNGGELKVVGGNTYDVNAPFTIGSEAMLNIFDGTLDVNDTLDNNGTIEGFGTIDLLDAVVTRYGRWAPGNSAGRTRVRGTHSNESSGMEIGFFDGIVQQDKLEVTQSINLGGLLELSQLPGTLPAGTYPLIVCEGGANCRTGNFNLISYFPACAGNCTIEYTDTSANLVVTAPLLFTCSWLGGTGNWSDSTRWDCNAVPTTDGNVIIDSGEVIVDAPITVNGLTLNGGMLTGSGNLTTSQFFALNGGNFALSGRHTMSNMSLSNSPTISKGTLTLTGTSTWTNPNLTLSGNTRLRVPASATLNLMTDQPGSISKSGGGNPVFTVFGTMVKNGTAALSVDMPLQLYGDTLDISEGTLDLNSEFAYSGTVKGNGTLDLADATVNGLENGNFSPGASPGTLTIQGSYTNRTLNMEIEESGGSVSNDSLAVSGNIDLSGSTLNVNFTGNVPAGVYELVSFGTNTNQTQFEEVNLTPACNDCYLSYDAGKITLAKSCIPNLTLTNLTLETGTYRSLGELVSSMATVPSGQQVTFISDTGVSLPQDFTVELGGVFEVEIEVCQ